MTAHPITPKDAMKDPGLPLYRSRRRHDWRGWIIAAAAVVLLVAAMTLAWGAEGAGNPCAAERANWQRERAGALKVGRFYPPRVDTAWALVLQCEDGRRER